MKSTEIQDKALNNREFCNSLTEFSRFHTREVMVGDVGIGGNNPIRLQSMTTTDTMDTIATVGQSIRLVEAGCEIVRITAPSMNEAKNLRNIKDELLKRGVNVPLVADIHFTPNAAEIAAEIVEKVRVNPGNYADKKKFEIREYNDKEYDAELDRIREKFSPLVKICKERGTAMRIGTNHGSLSDRIMNRFGDTPLGMVESAFEFLRICEDLSYRDIVLSMKASNPKVMIEAYRLLMHKMIETDRNYPVHIGVTEAGDGEDGRIKSSIGIGSLLEDGIGDTVRVSLTEEPEEEIPVARILVDRYDGRAGHDPIKAIDSIIVDPFTFERRHSLEVFGIGGDQVPRVVIDLSDEDIVDPIQLKLLGYTLDPGTEDWTLTDTATDIIFLGDKELGFDLPDSLRRIYNAKYWVDNFGDKKHEMSFPLFNAKEFLEMDQRSETLNFISAGIHDMTDELLTALKNESTAVLILETTNEHGMAEQRRVFYDLMEKRIETPVIIKRSYTGLSDDELRVYAATDIGALLIDGLGSGVWITQPKAPILKLNGIAFNILQATRTRIFKTDYIACPSCGRTLFDLVEVTNMIRNRTNHLKGLKISVMGCIVNGPGEMADADYGYVGSGPGKITLYRGKEVVERSVKSEDALNKMISLIKSDGNWVEPAD
ncbi:MAG: (E)-4-hydroxy-3-methylbut-2-enyl-diphosphate synthase [Bacteroidetes bacterium]|nr:(E)-4-hydroxy-3-methylbut-2-enyl-diphosphate synthase [Bacteroidota bacterium]